MRLSSSQPPEPSPQSSHDDYYRWLFIVDGIITIAVSFFLILYWPASATQTTGRFRNFRQKEWFNEREKAIAVTRTIRDDPTKVKHLTTRVTVKDFIDVFTDRYLWGHFFITMIGLTPTQPLAQYLPTVIKSFHYNVFVAKWVGLGFLRVLLSR